MKKIYVLFLILFAYSAIYANTNSSSSTNTSITNDWVIKITVDNNNIIELDTTYFQYEISNYANANGVSYDVMKQALNDDIGLWQFVSQIIDLELLYYQAKVDGYDKKEEVLNEVDITLDSQIAQIYATHMLDSSTLDVTESEKRAFWNRESSRITAMYGPGATYANLEKEIERNLIQEKMSAEYKKLIEKYRKEKGLKSSINQDPIVTIGDFEVPKENFNKMFDETIKSAGGQIPLDNPDVLAQVKSELFNTFVAQQIILYESKENDYLNSDEGKIIEKFVKRSVITKKYIEDTIFSKIGDSTEAEMDEAYLQYGQRYNIDSLPYEQAEVLLNTLVKQSKASIEQTVISSDLRYKYKIEKNLDLLKNSL